ncbi:MAG: di-trans,poly-cis-decaprenylcistransferase [Spirochaetaceae bacterium]|jgi:undecaprenyl diphosphate synthase|nr:di-trans,poly-cis-decaprenylcistransferase [Spirochaetaceae bacterium]
MSSSISSHSISPHSSVPSHIGIIMDGNGRWARKRNRIRTQGHLEGLKTAKRIVKTASDMGIAYLSLYVFSTENRKRTAEEVGFIMTLVKQYLLAEMEFFRKNHIRIRHAGDPAGLPPNIAEEIRQACRDTEGFEGLQVILALNYGGRDEILRAVKRFLAAGKPPEALTEAAFREYLDNPDVPDPDLIIRTGGEFRTSNFLLWEGAYAEYLISDKLWPDWSEVDLENAVSQFAGRERKFGAVPADPVDGKRS